MFAKLAALGAVLSLLGKFKAVAWLIPGVGPVLGAVAGAAEFLIKGVVAFVKWLLVDITDAFREPQRFVVRAICVLAAICLGAYWGIKWDAHKVEQARGEAREWKAAHKKLMDDARTANAGDKTVFDKAVAARNAAEAAEKAKIVAPGVALVGPVPPVAPAAQPDSVRQPARKAAPRKDDGGEAGVSWLQSVFGGLK